MIVQYLYNCVYVNVKQNVLGNILKRENDAAMKCFWHCIFSGHPFRRDIYSKLIIKVLHLEHSQKRKQCSNDMKCSCQITAVAPSLSLSTNCWLTRSDERLQLASLDNSKDGSKIFDKSLPQHHWIIILKGSKKKSLSLVHDEHAISLVLKKMINHQWLLWCNCVFVYLYLCRKGLAAAKMEMAVLT